MPPSNGNNKAECHRCFFKFKKCWILHHFSLKISFMCTMYLDNPQSLHPTLHSLPPVQHPLGSPSIISPFEFRVFSFFCFYLNNPLSPIIVPIWAWVWGHPLGQRHPSVTTSLPPKKSSSLSTSCRQLSTAPQLGVVPQVPLFLPCWSSNWLDFV